MISSKIKLDYNKVIPTVLVLVFTFSLFAFLLGYAWGLNTGRSEMILPAANKNNLFLPFKPINHENNVIPAPSATGYITL